jgi:hypothetical protein
MQARIVTKTNAIDLFMDSSFYDRSLILDQDSRGTRPVAIDYTSNRLRGQTEKHRRRYGVAPVYYAWFEFYPHPPFSSGARKALPSGLSTDGSSFSVT